MKKLFSLQIVGKHGRLEVFPVGTSELPLVVLTTTQIHRSSERNAEELIQKQFKAIRYASKAGHELPKINDAISLGTMLGKNLKRNFQNPPNRQTRLIVTDAHQTKKR